MSLDHSGELFFLFIRSVSHYLLGYLAAWDRLGHRGCEQVGDSDRLHGVYLGKFQLQELDGAQEIPSFQVNVKWCCVDDRNLIEFCPGDVD